MSDRDDRLRLSATLRRTLDKTEGKSREPLLDRLAAYGVSDSDDVTALFRHAAVETAPATERALETNKDDLLFETLALYQALQALPGAREAFDALIARSNTTSWLEGFIAGHTHLAERAKSKNRRDAEVRRRRGRR